MSYIHIFNPVWVNFVYGVRWWFSFIYVSCGCPVFPPPLWKRLSFLHCISLLLCHKLSVYICMGLFWGFHSFDLCICFSAHAPLFCLLWLCSMIPLALFFFPLDCFNYAESSVGPCKFLNLLFIFINNIFMILIGIRLNLDCFM